MDSQTQAAFEGQRDWRLNKEGQYTFVVYCINDIWEWRSEHSQANTILITGSISLKPFPATLNYLHIFHADILVILCLFGKLKNLQ